MSYKPEDYSDIAPYLLVGDVQAELDFLEAAFVAERLRVFHNARGAIAHAEVRIGDSVVMMGRTQETGRAHVHLYLADPDGAMERSIRAGATRVQGMIETADGARRGGVRDPQGTTWWLTRQMERGS